MKIEKEKLLIRQADLNDLDLLIKNRLKFLDEVPGQEHIQQDVEILEKSLRDYFSCAITGKTFVAFIAEYEGIVASAGGLVIRYQPGNYTVPMGKTGYILSMYTLPEYRKNGLGSMIFEKLIEYGKSVNIEKFELHATNDGEPIYRKYGFIPPHDVWLELNIK